jgi:hypothetical protein
VVGFGAPIPLEKEHARMDFAAKPTKSLGWRNRHVKARFGAKSDRSEYGASRPALRIEFAAMGIVLLLCLLILETAIAG